MRYEGTVIRPPSEAYSLIVQITLGCAHNKCSFCSTFKDKPFRMRDLKEVLEDLDWARAYYRSVKRIFLADGDALVLRTDRLLSILDYIARLFPECTRVTAYGTAQDILRKSPDELKLLREHGLRMVYMGGESGNSTVLRRVNKGATREQMIEAVHRLRQADILTSVTFISGLGGQELWREHAVDTGTIISEMEPDYASLLTLLVEPDAPLYQEIEAGRFHLLTPEETVQEAALLIENVNLTRKCVFRSNHPSNYVSLSGDLPDDRQALLAQLASAKQLRPERFRAF